MLECLLFTWLWDNWKYFTQAYQAYIREWFPHAGKAVYPHVGTPAAFWLQLARLWHRVSFQNLVVEGFQPDAHDHDGGCAVDAADLNCLNEKRKLLMAWNFKKLKSCSKLEKMKRQNVSGKKFTSNATLTRDTYVPENLAETNVQRRCCLNHSPAWWKLRRCCAHVVKLFQTIGWWKTVTLR